MNPVSRVWGGRHGPRPVVLATSAFNGLATDAHKSWAFWRADGSALTESPFRLLNGERATMSLIRSLPPTEYGYERLWKIAERALKGLEPTLDTIPGTPVIGLFCALSPFLGEQKDPYFGPMGERVERQLSQWLHRRGGQGTARCFASGHAGLADAMHSATQALERGTLELAIVGGLDSYFDPLVFDILEERESIFDQRRTDGFIPGEGAAFALVTGERTASRLPLTPQVAIEALAAADEPAPMFTDGVCLAKGLTRVMRACTARLSEDNDRLQWVFGDLTNEEYRVREFQQALPRSIAPGGLDTAGASYRDVAADDMLVEFVPDGFGDLGAASMPTALSVTFESFLRGDPHRNNCLVVGSSTGARRGAMLLRRI